MIPPTSEPRVKPLNMIMTISERERVGAYSEVRAIPLGMQPPRPRPVRKRRTSSWLMSVAQAVARVNRPNRMLAVMITGRRPSRSAKGAINRAPSISPIRPAENTGPSCGGFRRQALIREGAA